MKAILIDPFVVTANTETGALDYTGEPVVREIEIDHKQNGIEGIYEALTHPLHEVRLFDVVRINKHGDGIFVDDEGLLEPRDHWFMWEGYNQPLAGRGLILGMDDEGESCAPQITLEEVKSRVTAGFANIQVTGHGQIRARSQHVLRAWGFVAEVA